MTSRDPARITRRTAIRGSLAACSVPLVAPASGVESAIVPAAGPKKSINLWAFPYPGKMGLGDCLRLAKDSGFEGIELNYDLESDLSPKSSTREFEAIRKSAEEIGIAISGLCSFLYWPYSLTANEPDLRARGLELAGKMIRAARDLGTDNLLTIAGSVYIPWNKDATPVALADCERRSREAIGTLLPLAEEAKVSLNIENIFFNGYLLSPRDMIDYVDSFRSDRLKVHFDTGNIGMYQFPEDWIRALGKRIKNVHLKEFDKATSDHSLETFTRAPLFGSTDWPAVMAAFREVGYDGWLTWEYFKPTRHHPEVAIGYTARAMDAILGGSA